MAISIDKRIEEINQINCLQLRDQWVNRLHPLVKFSLTVFFVVMIMSLDRFELSRLISFAIFPIIMFNLADLKLKDALYRMRLVLPLVLAVGIFNPFLDKSPVFLLGSFTVTGGMISMLTLVLKGLYAVLATYALIATTGIEDICYALRCIKVPKVIVTVILLIYRYLFILMEEAGRISAAYSLRAPSQKGLNYRTWGPIVGQWLLRSMDRAENVYESMCLRGFTGEFTYSARRKAKARDYIFAAGWTLCFFALRLSDVVYLIGKILVR